MSKEQTFPLMLPDTLKVGDSLSMQLDTGLFPPKEYRVTWTDADTLTIGEIYRCTIMGRSPVLNGMAVFSCKAPPVEK